MPPAWLTPRFRVPVTDHEVREFWAQVEDAPFVDPRRDARDAETGFWERTCELAEIGGLAFAPAAPRIRAHVERFGR